MNVSYGAIYKSADNKTHSNAYLFRNENKLITLPVALPSSPMPKLTEKNVILFLPHKVRMNQLNLILILSTINLAYFLQFKYFNVEEVLA